MKEKTLLKGNEAFAMAAINVGCRYYFGYPITPQNEIPEYMSRELEKHGGAFIQAESELAAVNMAYGAAAAGGKVMISSSSPGIALMQEGFSVIASVQIPMVIMNVMRGGPGIGTIQPGQADYYQVTRGGGNGDYHIFVFAPSSIQEAVDMIEEAFSISEQYRNPVIIAADGMLGQMMEPIVLPEIQPEESKEQIRKEKPWALTGHKNEREHNVIKSLFLKQELLAKNIDSYWPKYEKAREELQRWESTNVEKGEIIFAAYGTTARVVVEAMDSLKKKGVSCGLIRPKSLWPFPEKAFENLGDHVKQIIVVELSKGQFIDDVKLAIHGQFPVSLINRYGGVLLDPKEIEVETIKLLEVEQ